MARGGTSPGSVSKSTYVVVAGASPGASKLTKAERFGMPMTDEQDSNGSSATGETATGINRAGGDTAR